MSIEIFCLRVAWSDLIQHGCHPDGDLDGDLDGGAGRDPGGTRRSPHGRRYQPRLAAPPRRGRGWHRLPAARAAQGRAVVVDLAAGKRQEKCPDPHAALPLNFSGISCSGIVRWLLVATCWPSGRH